jgi:hypothetical protein
MKILLSALAGLAMLAFAAGPASALSQNGPYYAQPSWDQQIPAASRFIVLTDWGSAAVLDRETGLVWERQPANPAGGLEIAGIIGCQNVQTGGRQGWRLPRAEELLSLVDPTRTNRVSSGGAPALPVGHPFIGISAGPYWAIDPAAIGTSEYSIVFLDAGEVNLTSASDTNPVWCVRGGSGAP